MKKIIQHLILAIIGIIAIPGFSEIREPSKYPLVEKVDPFIGTGGHGHTYPGATLPFGLVQLSPDTFNNGWDWCSGYHITDSSIMGFSHTHLSGTGSSDYGDFLFMPTTGKLNFQPGTRENPDKGYRSRFSHDKESAKPGYYQVQLTDYNVDAELTATTRVGMHKYTFPKTKQANIIIDLTHAIHNAKVLESNIEIISDTEIRGYVKKSGWARNRYIYFAAQFSRPFVNSGLQIDNQLNENAKIAEGTNLKGYVRFDTTENQVVLIKVGLSTVSSDGAAGNIKQECPNWDFEKVRDEAMACWEKQLSKITVEGGSENDLTIFYTSLYHSSIVPNISSDADGQYRGMDGKIHKAKNGDNYTVFSLWDTFRAFHPLMTIIDEKRTNDFITSMLDKYDQAGRLPKWELAATETWAMIGYHAVSVIADAWSKNIRDYDVQKAYEAMKTTAMQDYPECKYYRLLGYVPFDKVDRSVSRTVEFAYDDWCIALMAKKLGNKYDQEIYAQRSKFYRNVFDSETGFMRGKDSEGNWRKNFNPNQNTGEFVEGNSWHYTWFTPHDVQGLIELMGGDEAYVANLDKLFTSPGKEHMDVSGLIGQYAHGNEPSHNFAYLYNYAGTAWKTQEKVSRIINELYSTNPDGICGNEDCGQMSAWHVFSAMGFYPVCPGQPNYAIGTPLFGKVAINLENGNTFEVLAKGVSKKNIYIQSATLNGQPYDKSYIRHADITSGGNLTFQMGPEPNKQWASDNDDRPFSESVEVPDAEKTPSRTIVGQIEIPVSGLYTFKIESVLGTGEIYLGEKLVAKGELTAGKIEKGKYPLRIQPVYPLANNRLVISVKAPETDKYTSILKFCLRKSQWAKEDKLSQIPDDTQFMHPDKMKHISLATGKPMTCSGGTQQPNKPEKAVDAIISNSSGWHSGSSPQWIKVDLEKSYKINRIKLYTYNDNNRYYRYKIEVSQDDDNYSLVVDEGQNTTPSTADGFEHKFETQTARYVKVTMLSNSANPGVHVNEIMVFEDNSI